MSYPSEPAILFDPGRVTATPGALEELKKAGIDPVTLIDRHVTGDFGDVGIMGTDSLDSDQTQEHSDSLELNSLAILNGADRILSIYTVAEGSIVWVDTVSDRSYTTIMLPEDY